MNKAEFYNILDIESPEEFTYYENMASLLEEDSYIDVELLRDLINDVDKETFAELLDSYFEEFLRVIPDEYTDMYITVETLKRTMLGALQSEMNELDCAEYAELLEKFRKWYVSDQLVFDLKSGRECCVRDARYDLIAENYTDEEYDFDFRTAYDFDTGGYDFRVSDMIESALEQEE